MPDLRSNRPLRLLAAGLLALAVLGPADVSAETVPDASFDYLYIEGNEDQASGGHAAIRIDDDVFHFQYQAGLLRMERDAWNDFQLSYRGFQNRSIHRSRIAVTSDSLDLLRAAFVRKHLTQTEQIDRLLDARSDGRLVAALTDESIPAQFFPGLGFYTLSDEPVHADASTRLAALRSAIDARYGAEFRPYQEQQLREALVELEVQPLESSAADFEPGVLPRPRYAFHQRYADAVAAIRSLEALRGGAFLASEALLADASSTQLPLANEDRLALARAAEQLQQRLVSLAAGTRPDWGTAMLFGMARLDAMAASLERGSWVMLDPLADDSVSYKIGPRRRAVLPQMQNEAHADWVANKQKFRSQEDWDERTFARLERAASRLSELRLAGEGAHILRLRRDSGLPKGMGRLTDPPRPRVLSLEGERLSRATELAATRTESLTRAALGYQLMTRNCVSELFATVDLAMARALERVGKSVDAESRAAELEMRLGAAFDASPIPFVSSRQVRTGWRVVSADYLPSLRLARAEALFFKDPSPWLRLRESNTLTSTLYAPGDRDSYFVFFTDDQVLPRPLEGVANLVAGLGRAGLGLLQLPFDGGDSVKAGLRGALFSLPELAFFNIRKGSNAWIPVDLRPVQE